MEKSIEDLTKEINSLKDSISRKEKELLSLEDQLSKTTGQLCNKRFIQLTELALKANEAKKFVRIDIFNNHYYIKDFNVESFIWSASKFIKINCTEKITIYQEVNNTSFPKSNIRAEVSSKKHFGLDLDIKDDDAVNIHFTLISEKEVKNFIAMAIGNTLSKKA